MKMSKDKNFREDAFNFATGFCDPRSQVDIFLEGVEWACEQYKLETVELEIRCKAKEYQADHRLNRLADRNIAMEAKLREYEEQISALERALKIADRDNAAEEAMLRAENIKLKKELKGLS
jgi:hypothetical protein